MNNNLKKEILKLNQLKRGWYNGEGYEFNKNGLFWLSLNVGVILNNLENNIKVYPMVNGNVSLEGSFDNSEISIEINIISKVGYYSDVNLITSVGTHCDFNLKKHNELKKLNNHLKEIFTIQ